MDVERLIERLHATAKNLRAIGELPPEMSVFFGPNLPEEAAAALAKLQAERDEAIQKATTAEAETVRLREWVEEAAVGFATIGSALTGRMPYSAKEAVSLSERFRAASRAMGAGE